MPNSQIGMVVRDDDGQTAIVSAVAITQEDPSGLEAFTWAQRINVPPRRTDGNPEPVFGQPETVF